MKRIIKKTKKVVEYYTLRILGVYYQNKNIPIYYAWKIQSDDFIKRNDVESFNWFELYGKYYKFHSRRIDKIKISQYFDHSFDINIIWKRSAFSFWSNTSYQLCKSLINDWISKNKYLHSINWFSPTMTSLRLINWILFMNFNKGKLDNDPQFKRKILHSILIHTIYISKNTEVKTDGYASNHATTNFTALLFASLTLKDLSISKKWLKQAINGLNYCISYQTLPDGVNFECSIPYHRLNLELFSYSTIICLHNNIDLSEKYFHLLFRMMEYVAAYIDKNGNAPQIGDNDSTRIVFDKQISEFNHSYLLCIGNYIFNYQFKSICKEIDSRIINYLPLIKSTDIEKIKPDKRNTTKSISFTNAGAYILKNENLSVFIACFSSGQKGKGGHNHVDQGSITVSIDGNQLIVDPGTYTYTHSRAERDYFRSEKMHNMPIHTNEIFDLSKNGYWTLKQYLEANVEAFKHDQIKIQIKNIKNPNFVRSRNITITNNQIKITDKMDGAFASTFIFHPDYKDNIEDFVNILEGRYKIIEIPYSPSYYCKVTTKAIRIYGNMQISYIISANNNFLK